MFRECICAHGDKHVHAWVPMYVHMCFYVCEGCVCVHRCIVCMSLLCGGVKNMEVCVKTVYNVCTYVDGDAGMCKYNCMCSCIQVWSCMECVYREYV